MKRTLQTILFALVAMMVPIGVLAQTSTIDLSTLTGTYVVNDSEEYIFTGTGSHGIKVESGNPRIVLNNASITVGEGSAIDIASGSNATIFVLGDNTIDTIYLLIDTEECERIVFFLFFIYLRSVNCGCGLGECDKSRGKVRF